MNRLLRRTRAHRMIRTWRASRALARTPRELIEIWIVLAHGLAERYFPMLRSEQLHTLVINGPAGGRTLTLRRNAWDAFTFYEVFLKEVYRQALPLPPSATIVDLGANIGLASAYFELNAPGSAIVAVEPEPDNFALLERNLADRNAKLHRAVVNDKGGEVMLELATTTRHRIQRGASTSAARIPVAALTLDQLLDESERADLLKVDIEGAEEEVFARDWKVLQRTEKVMIEVHHQAGADAITDRLVASGFRHLPRPSGEGHIDCPETYIRSS